MASKKKVLKFIVLGDNCVGKTSVINQYVNKGFNDKYTPTIGADFETKEVMIGEKLVILQIWDTAGLERFQSLGVAFYRGSHGFILVYDVTNPKSFDSLDSWREQFFLHATRDVSSVVIGNKTDMENKAVTEKQIQDWCHSNGDIPCFQTSAKESINIQEAFEAIVKNTLVKETEAELCSVNPDSEGNKNQRGCTCCIL